MLQEIGRISAIPQFQPVAVVPVELIALLFIPTTTTLFLPVLRQVDYGVRITEDNLGIPIPINYLILVFLQLRLIPLIPISFI